MLWTEKYRPKNFDEVLGNLKAKKEILNWTEQWLEGNPQKCLFILGPPGTGKTTFAHLIGNEFSDSLELNASDKRSYDIIMNTVGEASATKSLFNDGLKLIILDEVDGIHGTDDRGGTRAINKVIKEGHHPVVMMANDPYSKRIQSFKSKCKVITLRKVHTNSIVSLLKKICVKEGVKFEEHVLRNLAKRSKGDLRSAIGDLEVIASGKDSITSDDLEIISEKDKVNNIFDSVRTVLKSKNPQRIKDAMRVDSDPGFILELITENIPREYEKADEIEKAYEMVALADTYLGRAFTTRTYTYWKYSYDLMSLGVAFAKKDTYKKFTRYASSSIFTKLSKSRAKRDLRDRVAEKIGERLHISKKVAIEQFPYFEIMFQKDDLAYDLMKYFNLEDDEVKLFRSRKVKVKKPKKRGSRKKKADTKTSKSKTTETRTKSSKKGSKEAKKSKGTSKSNNGKEKSENSKEGTKKSGKKADEKGKQVSLFSFK